jgi:hypothetical protein
VWWIFNEKNQAPRSVSKERLALQVLRAASAIMNIKVNDVCRIAENAFGKYTDSTAVHLYTLIAIGTEKL